MRLPTVADFQGALHGSVVKLKTKKSSPCIVLLQSSAGQYRPISATLPVVMKRSMSKFTRICINKQYKFSLSCSLIYDLMSRLMFYDRVFTFTPN